MGDIKGDLPVVLSKYGLLSIPRVLTCHLFRWDHIDEVKIRYPMKAAFELSK